MAKVLRIAKWNQTFEKSASRKCNTATWVSVPNNTRSTGMVAMFEDFGDRQPLMYGAWVYLCCEASKLTHRGVLATSRGRSVSVSRLAQHGFTAELLTELIDWAKQPDVGWIEELEFEAAISMVPTEAQPELAIALNPEENEGSENNTPKNTEDFSGPEVVLDRANSTLVAGSDATNAATTQTTSSIPPSLRATDRQTGQDRQTRHPPPTPSSSQPDQWAAVEGELLSEGVAKARDVARGARARGCSHLEVRAALEHWRAHRPTWDAGALVRRLENLEHGQEIAMLWPPSSKAAQIAESRERSFEKQAELEAEKANAKQKLKQNASKMQALEGRYGGYLDSMTEKQIRKFATNCGLEFLLKSYRGKEGVRGLLRESLLQDLANANFKIPEGVPA